MSKWDVSSVSNMNGMFRDAASFNSDISNWDVSSVTTMDGMFQNAASFNHKLCQAAWVKSKASRKNMFRGSFGSISRTVCTSMFASKAALVNAVVACTTSFNGDLSK